MKAFHTVNQRQRPIFLQIGLIISISLCLVAFEWSTPYEIKIDNPDNDPFDPIVTIIDPVDPIPLPKMPEPPKIEKKRISDPFNPSVSTDPKPISDPNPISSNPDTLAPEIPVLSIGGEVDNVIEDPVIIADQRPSFPGGDAAMYKFIYSIIQYPERASSIGVKGKVMVSFVVEKDGSISNIKILNNPYGFGLEEEAIRVIKMMPKWNEGWHQGKPVRAYFNLPINFK